MHLPLKLFLSYGYQQPGLLSWCSDCLRVVTRLTTGRSKIWPLLQGAQSSSGAHPGAYPTGAVGCFSKGKVAGANLVPRLNM